MKKIWILFFVIIVITGKVDTFLRKMTDNGIFFENIGKVFPQGKTYVTRIEKNITEVLKKPIEDSINVAKKINELTDYTIEPKTCFENGVEYSGHSIFKDSTKNSYGLELLKNEKEQLFFWTENMLECQKECEKQNDCHYGSVTGAWPNDKYKCYLFENEPQKIDNENHVSFKIDCKQKEDAISKKYLMEFKQEWNSELKMTQEEIVNWILQLIHILKLNLAEKFHWTNNRAQEVLSNMIVKNHVKRSGTTVNVDMGNVFRDIGNFFMHIFHYQKAKKLQNEITDVKLTVQDMQRKYEEFQIEVIQTFQQNFFLHSINRVYNKGMAYLKKVIEGLKIEFTGIFELLMGQLSESFLNLQQAEKIYDVLKATAKKDSLEINLDNVTSLYKSEFTLDWKYDIQNNSTILQVNLETNSIDMKSPFNLFEFVNIPFEFDSKWYIFDTMEHFFAVNDGHWYNITNSEEYKKFDNRTIDDRSYLVYEKSQFHENCGYKNTKGFFCENLKIRKNIRNKCLANLFMGFLDSCELKQFKENGTFYEKLSNGKQIIWVHENTTAKLICENGTNLTEDIKGLYELDLPEDCTLQLPDIKLKNYGKKLVNEIYNVGNITTIYDDNGYGILLNNTKKNSHPHFFKNSRKMKIEKGSDYDLYMIILIIIGVIVLGILIFIVIQSCRKPIDINNTENKSGCFEKFLKNCFCLQILLCCNKGNFKEKVKKGTETETENKEEIV